MKVLFVLALLAGPAFAQDSEAAMQLYNKGVRELDAGKGDDARKNFEEIIKDYPTSAYAKLARLPSPTLKPVAVGDWVRRVAQLASRSPVACSIASSAASGPSRM